jgi:RNA polymerase-binding transcription factor DksA
MITYFLYGGQQMNIQLSEIKNELELIKNELLHRLQIDLVSSKEENFYNELSNYDSQNKQKVVIDAIYKDLYDVEIALKKIDDGNYGYCELTGEQLPYNKLRILPTGRTIYDFSFVREHY